MLVARQETNNVVEREKGKMGKDVEWEWFLILVGSVSEGGNDGAWWGINVGIDVECQGNKREKVRGAVIAEGRQIAANPRWARKRMFGWWIVVEAGIRRMKKLEKV